MGFAFQKWEKTTREVKRQEKLPAALVRRMWMLVNTRKIWILSLVKKYIRILSLAEAGGTLLPPFLKKKIITTGLVGERMKAVVCSISAPVVGLHSNLGWLGWLVYLYPPPLTLAFLCHLWNVCMLMLFLIACLSFGKMTILCQIL